MEGMREVGGRVSAAWLSLRARGCPSPSPVRRSGRKPTHMRRLSQKQTSLRSWTRSQGVDKLLEKRTGCGRRSGRVSFSRSTSPTLPIDWPFPSPHARVQHDLRCQKREKRLLTRRGSILGRGIRRDTGGCLCGKETRASEGDRRAGWSARPFHSGALQGQTDNPSSP